MQTQIKVPLYIKDDVLLAPNVFITTNNHNFDDYTKPIHPQGSICKTVKLKQGCWMAKVEMILPGVTV